MPWNTAGNIKGPKGDKGEPGNAADVAALIHAATSKTPVDADEMPLLDSTASWSLRKFTWATLKSTLQALFFYRGNIVGNVSQSAGVPTGAIIQRGSNASGEFVRYADGTLDCWISINIPNGNVAAGGFTQLAGGWSFPAAFVSGSIPFVAPALHGSYASAYRVGFDSTSNTSVPNIYIENGRSATTPTPGSLNLLAKGRWF